MQLTDMSQSDLLNKTHAIISRLQYLDKYNEKAKGTIVNIDYYKYKIVDIIIGSSTIKYPVFYYRDYCYELLDSNPFLEEILMLTNSKKRPSCLLFLGK
jgi:hypothetical protein